LGQNLADPIVGFNFQVSDSQMFIFLCADFVLTNR
jgi:hypothetical protein